MTGYVALGSNLGDRVANLRAGLAGLARNGLAPVALSSVWETEPVGTSDPAWFLNMVARIETDLAPLEVLERLLGIEREAGRVRTVPNAARVLDLDLLLLGDRTWIDARLVLPHPRMWDRRFVVEPLRELDRDLRAADSGEPIDEVARRLGGTPVVRRLGTIESLGPRAG